MHPDKPQEREFQRERKLKMNLGSEEYMDFDF